MTHVDPAGSCVTLREHATRGGTKLAHAELNSEATLNSVSLEMIQILQPALERWRADDSVSAVLITGAGDRAFSAGGDIQALYRAMVANHEAGVTVDEYPFQFFEQEYRLDYLIHNFSKPLICVGHAIVMGGGLGIFSGARFRVVSEKCRIAFPEVSIGLFPDAGGTWMLRNLVPGIAAFIGMTGSSVNAADALASGIATHHTRLDARGDILTVLTRLDLGGDADTDSSMIDAALSALPAAPLPAGEFAILSREFDLSGSYAEVAGRIEEYAGASEWAQRGIATMQHGCATSVGIVIEQLRRSPALDMADCFRMEMDVASHCALFSEFTEGIRALIIEKDNQPRWRHASIAELDEAQVLAHFEPAWPENPLADLALM